MRKFFIFFILAAFILSCKVVMAASTPEQVYKEYIKAMKEGDFDKAISLTTLERQKEINKMDKAKREKILKFLQTLLPVDLKITITSKKIQEKEAYLFVESVKKNPFTKKVGKAYGKVHFLKENGEWKIDRESWRSKPW